jgi:hypothetical protein
LQSSFCDETPGPGGRQFHAENIFIFTLSSEGDKIVTMEKFVDTVFAADFIPPLLSLRSSDRLLVWG